MGTIEYNTKLLTDLVREFQVCWEVSPVYAYVREERKEVGFVLELYGTHEPWVEHPEAGCDHCLRVFTALQTIAEGILPEEFRPSRSDLGIYDQAIHYARKRAGRPDVVLPIKITHREGYERPVDECENRCLTEMKQRLREMGAYEGRWKPMVETDSGKSL